MLEHASKICVKYQNNCGNCPLRSTCKSKIFLSREDVILWVKQLDYEAKKILKGEIRNE